MKTNPLILLCLVATLAPAIPALGQTPEDPIAGIDESLREIASLMRLQLASQRAELAVRRLDITRRELAEQKGELHEAESSRDGYDSQLAAMQAQIELFEDVPPEQLEEMETWRSQAEIELANLKQAAWRADQRVLDLNREIEHAREDLAIWEEIVRRAFEED